MVQVRLYLCSSGELKLKKSREDLYGMLKYSRSADWKMSLDSFLLWLIYSVMTWYLWW